MGVVVGILVVVGALVAVVVLGAVAAGGRVAAAGRAGGELLVAPRGAGFGEASRLVVAATRAERTGPAAVVPSGVVQLHEHRARRHLRRTRAAA